MSSAKQAVEDFWDSAACGEDLYLGEGYAAQARQRYRLEPYIPGFAKWDEARGKAVLEIGVGLGADHESFARAGAILSGIDLTRRAIDHTKARFAQMGLHSDLKVADAEALPFADGAFDVVYSWGVIHHSPDTARCVSEINRVLKPDGVARVMIYNKHSLIGYMLWLRYAGLALKWSTPLSEIYAAHLESPGTKAYSIAEARALFSAFRSVEIETMLTHADLLSSEAGQRHCGVLLSVAKALWPRPLFRLLMPRHGLFMMIAAVK